MKTLEVRKLGSVGLITDAPDWQLPMEAWSSVQNVRCDNDKIGTFPGYTTFTTPTVDPYFLLPFADDGAYYWMYMGLAKGYVFDGTTHTDITRTTGGDYTGAATDRWNGGVLNGVPILNNGIDEPQMWSPTSPATKLANLTAWDSSWIAKVIKPYKEYLVALNVTKGSTKNPYMVKWSDSADPGAVPASWDEADATTDAGETVLAQTGGVILDAMELRDELIIYKEDAVHGMQWTGGQFVFRFRKINAPGILAQGCAAEFKGGHFVVGAGDVYVHNGQSWESVIDDRNRDFLYDQIDPDNYAATFVVKHEPNTEMWICYPSNGAEIPNRALVWNYKTGAWYSRELPNNTPHIVNGITYFSSTAYTWDTHFAATWDTWFGQWGSRSYSPVQDILVGASVGAIFQFESGNQANGSNMKCVAERTGINLGQLNEMHEIVQIYPLVEGQTVDVYVGFQDTLNAPVTWSGPFPFDPSTDYKVDVQVNGRLHSIRFQSESDTYWRVNGYTLEYEYSGV